MWQVCASGRVCLLTREGQTAVLPLLKASDPLSKVPWLARVRAGGGEPFLKSVFQVVCGLVFRFGHTVLVRRDRSRLLRALSSFISAGAGRLIGLVWHCKRYQASLWQGTPGVHSDAIRPKGNRAASAWQGSWHQVSPKPFSNLWCGERCACILLTSGAHMAVQLGL